MEIPHRIKLKQFVGYRIARVISLELILANVMEYFPLPGSYLLDFTNTLLQKQFSYIFEEIFNRRCRLLQGIKAEPIKQ